MHLQLQTGVPWIDVYWLQLLKCSIQSASSWTCIHLRAAWDLYAISTFPFIGTYTSAIRGKRSFGSDFHPSSLRPVNRYVDDRTCRCLAASVWDQQSLRSDAGVRLDYPALWLQLSWVYAPARRFLRAHIWVINWYQPKPIEFAPTQPLDQTWLKLYHCAIICLPISSTGFRRVFQDAVHALAT